MRKQPSFIQASPQDAPIIGRLRQAVWAQTYRGIYTDQMIDGFDYAWHEKQDRSKILDPDFHVFLIRLPHQDIGYLIFRFQSGRLLLHSLNMLQEFHRLGIGTAALDRVRQFGKANGATEFVLQCSPWNTGAMAFYRAMGGSVVKEDLCNPERYMDAVWFSFPI